MELHLGHFDNIDKMKDFLADSSKHGAGVRE